LKNRGYVIVFDDRHDLKVDQIGPPYHPFIEHSWIVGLGENEDFIATEGVPTTEHRDTLWRAAPVVQKTDGACFKCVFGERKRNHIFHLATPPFPKQKKRTPILRLYEEIKLRFSSVLGGQPVRIDQASGVNRYGFL
jgi:hypothetical protein